MRPRTVCLPPCPVPLGARSPEKPGSDVVYHRTGRGFFTTATGPGRASGRASLSATSQARRCAGGRSSHPAPAAVSGRQCQTPTQRRRPHRSLQGAALSTPPLLLRRSLPRQELSELLSSAGDQLVVLNVALSDAAPCVHVFPAVFALARNPGMQGVVTFARLMGDATPGAAALLGKLGVTQARPRSTTTTLPLLSAH